MGSGRYGGAASAPAGSSEPVVELEPVSPELVLVCPELRTRMLERWQTEAAEAEVERVRPAIAPGPPGRVLLRPAVALLVGVPLLLLAGAWLETTMRGAPTQTVSVTTAAGASRQATSRSQQGVAGRTSLLAASSRAPVSQSGTGPGKPEPAEAPRTTRPPRAPVPVRLTSEETEPPVSLLGPLPDPTPPRRRLAPTVGRQLLGLAETGHVSWALLLARARMHTKGGLHAITLRELRPLARSLATVAVRPEAESRPARSGRPSRRERVLAAYYRAVGLDALISGLTGARPVLAARVLRDPRIGIYLGGRDDIAAGRVNVRVLALLLYLARTQGQVSVAGLVSGHQPSGSRQGSSAHAYGLAVDISALAHAPVRGHQRPGGRLDRALQTLRLLPAEVRPTQVISLLDLGPDSLALADHADYVHVGYAPVAHNTPDNLRALWQSAGARYGVPWQVLAAINKLETDDGRLLGTSTGGAIGWMQFLPSTWQRYGTDANGDGTANPQDPADAIYSAARYLQAAGASTDLAGAIYAYNHAGWYVTQVLALARTYH